MSNRQERVDLATATIDLLEKGSYVAQPSSGSGGDEILVNFQHVLNESIDNTTLHPQEEEILLPPIQHDLETNIIIWKKSSITCAYDFIQQNPTIDMEQIAILNFANARHPASGLRRGNWEQEEFNCLSSGLLRSLQSNKAKPFYTIHNPTKESIAKEIRSKPIQFYTSHMIYSPNVPIIRNCIRNTTTTEENTTTTTTNTASNNNNNKDTKNNTTNYKLLSNPFICNFISSCAVNYNTGLLVAKSRTTHDEQQANNIMSNRCLRVLQIAAYYNIKVLILGSWGCGIYKNDERNIILAWKSAILHPDMDGRFHSIIFAIPEPTIEEQKSSKQVTTEYKRSIKRYFKIFPPKKHVITTKEEYNQRQQQLQQQQQY